MYGRFAIAAAALVLSACGNLSYGQNPNYPGYLGVFVVEGNGGMRITSFIPDTPAEQLAFDGGIGRYHTIVRLGGRPTRSLNELRFARNRIPDGQEAKMILRTQQGDYYYCWIARSPAVAMMQAPGSYGSAKPGQGAPDRFYKGGSGQGGDQDFRPKGSGDGDEGGSAGSPAPGNPAPKPSKPNLPPGDEGDFRPKKN